MDCLEECFITYKNNELNSNEFLSDDMIKIIFKDAISHNRRHRTEVKNICKRIILNDYKDINPNKIIEIINNKYGVYKYIGPLTIYDISMGICRYYELKLDKIYIIKQCETENIKGPYNAIIKLGLKDKLKFERKIGIKNNVKKGEVLDLCTLEFDDIIDKIKEREDLKEMINYII